MYFQILYLLSELLLWGNVWESIWDRKSCIYIHLNAYLDCTKKPHGKIDLHNVGFLSIHYDVHTMINSPNDTFLRMYSHHYAMNDCINWPYNLEITRKIQNNMWCSINFHILVGKKNIWNYPQLQENKIVMFTSNICRLVRVAV